MPAVFVDDYGRERALTTDSAKSFSKKKLDAASRALERKCNLAMDKAIRASDRETARATRKLQRKELELDWAIARFFRRRIRTTVPPTGKIKHDPPKPRSVHVRPSRPALPSYRAPLRDRRGRLGVFFRCRYYGAKTARPGVASRVTKYIYRGAATDAAGMPMWRTNVGASVEEAVCGFDHLEVINRSSQKNAKVVYHAVLAMDHRWTPEQMLEVGEQWARERFGNYGLPYAISLHAPPPDGDERNWHLHAVWSWRTLQRVGDHEWLVGEALRNDLDGADGMRLLRERFAGISTLMSFEAGHCDVFTALSHAARQLPVEPQINLGEARTRRARAGEFVEANEENHERVLRSEAAMIEDDLRREEERLDREIEVARSSRGRTAVIRPMLSVPAAPYVVARLLPPLKAEVTEAISASAVQAIHLPPSIPTIAPSAAPAITMPRSSIGMKEFANLRISAVQRSPEPPVPPPITRPHLLEAPLRKFTVPSRARSVPLPALPPEGRAVPTLVPPAPVSMPRMARLLPGRLTAPVSLHVNIVVPPASVQMPPASATTAGLLSNPPASPFEVTIPQPLQKARILRPAKYPPSMNGIPVLPQAFASNSSPALQIPHPARLLPVLPSSGVIALPHPVPPLSPTTTPSPKVGLAPLAVPVNTVTFAELALQIAKTDNVVADEELTNEPKPPVRDGLSASDRNSLPSDPSLALAELLRKKRVRIRKEPSGSWVVPWEIAEEAGLVPEQCSADYIQKILQEQAQNQIEELREVLNFVAAAPQRHLVQTDGSWRLERTAPDRLRQIVDLWRNDPQVQEAFTDLAAHPPLTRSDANDIRIRQERFMSRVTPAGPEEDAQSQRNIINSAPKSNRSPLRFPDPAGTGIGD